MKTRSANFMGSGRKPKLPKSNRSFTRVNLLAVVGLAAAVVMFLAGFAFLSRSAATAAAPATGTLYLDNVGLGTYVDIVRNHL
ncbi:MAG: hypothetical protein HY301_09275, partial [Verrucomicrobia bacterium]|nr:hypothetical protein [Verrucomicrobiota bacterium]